MPTLKKLGKLKVLIPLEPFPQIWVGFIKDDIQTLGTVTASISHVSDEGRDTLTQAWELRVIHVLLKLNVRGEYSKKSTLAGLVHFGFSLMVVNHLVFCD